MSGNDRKVLNRQTPDTVIASAAKQSIFPHARRQWIASLRSQ